MCLHNLYSVPYWCFFLLEVELLSPDSIKYIEWDPAALGGKIKGNWLGFTPFQSHDILKTGWSVPLAKSKKKFRAFQIRQSSLAPSMSVLVKTTIFLLLRDCLRAGMGVLLWNSLLNSLGQRVLFCCVQIILGRERLMCGNVHRSFWDQGKDLR